MRPSLPILWKTMKMKSFFLWKTYTRSATFGAAPECSVFWSIKWFEGRLVAQLRLISQLSCFKPCLGKSQNSNEHCYNSALLRYQEIQFLLHLLWNTKEDSVSNSFFLSNFFNIFRGIILSIVFFILTGIHLFPFFTKTNKAPTKDAGSLTGSV